MVQQMIPFLYPSGKASSPHKVPAKPVCVLQHTYRPGTAVPLWRQVGGSGWSSSCG